jgi:hypothetical protein
MIAQWFSRPARLALIPILALLAGPVAGATPPPPDGSPTVCSGAPAEIGNVLAPEVATAEDVQAFRKAVNSLRAELDAVCERDKSALKLFQAKAKRVVFEMSAGATEPTAYLKDGQLVVEFYGGPFDARQFRRIVNKVLQGKPVPLND